MKQRDTLLKEILTFIPTYHNIALQWATGVGKSRAAIELCNKVRITLHREPSILLIVAETAHKKNWENEFIKWGASFTNITIECYASLKNYKNSNYDIVIFDEAHHLSSDLRLDIVDSIKADYVFLLSATLSDNFMIALSGIFSKFITSKVTLKEAISNKWLPKPKIYIIPINLSNTLLTGEIVEKWGKGSHKIRCVYADRWKYLKRKSSYPNTELHILCSQKQEYDYYTERFEYWKQCYYNSRMVYMRNQWMLAGSKRKRFLGDSKTSVAKGILSLIHNKRYICFCSSIKQAESLGGKNCIHSKKKDSLTVIDSFNKGDINNLYAVGMLQEGQNLNNIEADIIIQLDGKERAFIQKFGRGLRAEDPIQFILYYKGTRDEEYLNALLPGIDNKYINYVNNINDIVL
jgi:superfamily II DNA or RNA helicase